jgi:hypothetical protein
MNRNCLTCATKKRLPEMPNENGGDFYHCTAPIILPRFGMMDRPPTDVQRMVNIAMFQPDHPCFEWAMAQDCPTHTLLQSNTLEETNG